MNNCRFKLLLAGVLSLLLMLSGCGGDSGGGSSTVVAPAGDGTETGVVNDDGIDTGIAATPTTVAGKVTLSSIVSAKARAKAALEEASRAGKPGSVAYNRVMSKAANAQKAIDNREITSYSSDVSFSQGKVYLYNSSRPNWLLPVAEAVTDNNGIYILEKLINASSNLNADGTAAYVNGEDIPGGNYTLLAFTLKGLFPDLVALQSVVSEFAGTVPGIDLEASQSKANPVVTTMLGVSKNTDGTQTWGDNTLELAPNAAVQVSFSAPMFRAAVVNSYLEISSSDGGTVPGGLWTLSADWLTATYYPENGTTWDPGKTYTVKVIGTDGESGVVGAIYSVYGRFLEKTATGTFKIIELAEGEVLADLVDGKKPNVTISSPAFGSLNDVSVITPLRIVADERMDVNGLRVKSKPSLGAQPGVLFVGKTSNNLFEYEFLLGEPLKLGTNYTVTVVGGKDLAGNVMSDYDVSFTTEETSEGIPAIDASLTGAELEVAVKKVSNQTDVKDVFGKWVRAFNDHNLPQLQSVMTSEFLMEYNFSGKYEAADLNRDAALDLQEYAVSMTDLFLKWKSCDVTMVGSVVGDINVDVEANEANFAFTLVATANDKSRACQQLAVDQNLFANLEKVNGAWFISKASEGVDNRKKEVKTIVGIDLTEPADKSTPIFYDKVNEKNVDVAFSWTEVADSTAYIWMLFDSRDPTSGLALILPSNMTSIKIPGDLEALVKAETAANVAKDFGFDKAFDGRDGSQLFWQVAALGSNTVTDVLNKRATSLPADVVAKSDLWRFTIPGEYATLDYTVSPNDSSLQFYRDSEATENPADRFDGSDGAPVTYSEFINGFDVGEANFATISFSTSDENVTKGFVQIDGNTRIEKIVDFVNGTATITIPLNSGINNVMLSNGVPCWKTDSCQEGGNDIEGIEEWFQIQTSGGIQPIIFFGDGADSSGIIAIAADDVETVIENNAWKWFESPTAVSVKLSGKVNLQAGVFGDSVPTEVRIDLGSESGARASAKADVDSSTGEFTAELSVFEGENWVNVTASTCSIEVTSDKPCEEWARREFRDQFGLRTEAGSEYTPPIYNVVVTNVGDSTVLEQQEGWGDGGRWDASTVTGNQILISGFLDVTSGDSRYNAGSEGGWVDEKFSVALDGSFSITVDLYNGDNWINISDSAQNNFHLNVFTSLGKAVVRPEITEVLGADGNVIAYSGGDLLTDQCSITLKGTAMEGQLEANWNGQKDVTAEDASGASSGDDSERGVEWYGERAMTETVEVDGVHTFSLTLPLVGDPTSNDEPPGVWTENWIEVFDANWNRLGLRVINTGECDYVAPQLTVTAVKDSKGNALEKMNDWGNGGSYGSAVNTLSSKPFLDSEGFDVYSPVDDATDLGVGAEISGKVDLEVHTWSDLSVVRVLVFSSDTDELVSMVTTSSDDPMLQNAEFSSSTMSIDLSTGLFSTTVDIEASMPHIIEIGLWSTVNGMDADGLPMEPLAGHEIPVNGAVLMDNSDPNGDPGDPNGDPGDQNGDPGDPNGDPGDPNGDPGDQNGDPGDPNGDPAGNGDTKDVPGGTGGFGNNQSVVTDNISIEGTTNVRGGAVNIELEGCGGPERYSVTAESDDLDGDGWYEWATEVGKPVVVYDGNNNIRVRVGPMEYFIGLEADSASELPAPALVVSVFAGGTELSEYIDTEKKPKCGRSEWNAGDASSVTIRGTTTAPDGEGEWRADGQFGRFQIANGEFALEDMVLYEGENRFEVNDTRWNRHELIVTTEGGTQRPQYVTVSDITALEVGLQTITGTIHGQGTDGSQSVFNVKDMNIELSFGDVRYEFVTNRQELQWRENAKVIQLMDVEDSSTGDKTFSFTIFVPTDPWDDSPSAGAAQGWLNIWTGGENADGGWADHGLNTTVNDKCSGEDCVDSTSYWKAKR